VKVVVTPTDLEAARSAAEAIASLLEHGVAVKGKASIALSGGRTPRAMVQALAAHDLAWSSIHLFQVDERAVPLDHPARNWSMLSPLAERVPLGNRHPMPVDSPDADRRYAADLHGFAGEQPCLDVVQLGLGDDGHTASLVPGDPAVEVVDRDVCWVGSYGGHRRLTLTRPVLHAAGHQVWLVTGSTKSDVVRDLISGDSTAPSTLVVNRETATLFADAPAAARLSY
jgi:6-phosphogluconolactonase